MGQEKNTLNVPRIRFPEFKEEWKTTKLKTLFTTVCDSVDMDDEHTYELVTVKRNLGGIVSRGLMLGKDIKVKSQYYLKTGCLLFSKRQISHKACGIVPEEFNGAIVSNEYSILETSNELSAPFFFLYCHRPNMYQSFYLSSIGVHIEKMIFKLDDWLKRKFPIPSLPEQEKITSFLSDVDAKIENLTQQKAYMQQYKKGCMQKLFSQEIRFKDNDGNTFPDWEEKKLGEVFHFKNGLNVAKEKFGTGTKFINVLDIISNKPIMYSNIITSVETSPKEFDNYKVQYGDILFQRSSETREDVGQVNVYLDSTRESVFGGFVIRATPSTRINSLFYSYLLKTPLVRKEIMSKSGGSTRYNIGQESLASVSHTAPSLPEQNKIANLLFSIDEKIEILNKQLEIMKEFKKGLLQGMFV